MLATDGSLCVEFCGQSLCLLGDRAVWWAARSTLVVADVHLGKGAAFRKAGVPVPSGATSRDLARLDVLLQSTQATRLVILGDFFHAKSGLQPEVLDAIASWRRGHRDIAMTLVRGNHDRSSGRIPSDWKIDEVEEPSIDDGIVFSHAPRRDKCRPVLAGHVHPVYSLRDYDGSTVRVACFVIDEVNECRCIVLPAFGTFTGGHSIGHAESRRIFVTTGRRVLAVPCPQER